MSAPKKSPPVTVTDYAVDMVTGVRDEGPAVVYRDAAQLPPELLLDVIVRLAELVPDTKRLSDLLAWKTDGRRRHRLLSRARVVDLGECPSPAAYDRHVANGEAVDVACAAMHRRYERGYTLRRAA